MSEGFGLLFVCTGNICRSPMAEGMARAWIESEYPDLADGVRVGSAGTAALVGEGPIAEAEAVMIAQGIDIGGHRARDIGRGMLESNDLVLAMEDRQVRSALSVAPDASVYTLLRAAEAARNLLERREVLAGAEVPLGRLERLVAVLAVMERNGAWERDAGAYEVADPYGQPRDFYEWAAFRLEDPIREVLEVVFAEEPRAR